MRVELVDITDGAENLIAESARTCYKSVAKDSSSNAKLVVHLRDSGHLSTFEHAKATFRIEGISRACSHQLVRHRHFSFSQESQRYVDEEDFKYVTPDDVLRNANAREKYDSLMAEINSAYSFLLKEGVKKEDARFVLPNACETTIVVTANFRALREFIELRKTEKAQWEIRELSARMLGILREKAPNAFGDL
ncbi:MAG: FAD-dependent thymidylate synthase [Candidatus Altiarchaeota archaeon]